MAGSTSWAVINERPEPRENPSENICAEVTSETPGDEKVMQPTRCIECHLEDTTVLLKAAEGSKSRRLAPNPLPLCWTQLGQLLAPWEHRVEWSRGSHPAARESSRANVKHTGST